MPKKNLTPEYVTWLNMKSRCHNENHPDFHHYGGRGIVVCERWRFDFQAFLTDMGQRPFPRASIERIDVNGNYEPSNCRWVSQKDQTRNKRNNHVLTIDGETKPISVWAEQYGIEQKTVWKRLRRGWPPADAVKRPRLAGNTWSTSKGKIMVPAQTLSTP